MTQATRIYTQVIPGNGVSILNVAGGFYKVLATNGDIEISRQGGNAIGPILPGQGERANFNTLSIRNLTANQVTMRILIADNSFEDTRVYGEVSVIDGQNARTKQNIALQCGSFLAGVAAQFSMGQIFNPAGSAQNLIVTDINFGSSTATNMQLRSHNAALASAAGSVHSKNRNFTTSAVFQIWQENNTVLAGVTIGGRYLVQANDTFTYKPTDPILLPPGFGLIVANQTLAADLYFNIQAYSESVNL